MKQTEPQPPTARLIECAITTQQPVLSTKQ